MLHTNCLIVKQSLKGTFFSWKYYCIVQYSKVCNSCHNLLMMFINLEIAILNINGVDYCFNINEISKSETINVLQNADLKL